MFSSIDLDSPLCENPRSMAALAPKGRGDEAERPSSSRFPNIGNESVAQPSAEPQLVRARFRRGSELI